MKFFSVTQLLFLTGTAQAQSWCLNALNACSESEAALQQQIDGMYAYQEAQCPQDDGHLRAGADQVWKIHCSSAMNADFVSTVTATSVYDCLTKCDDDVTECSAGDFNPSNNQCRLAGPGFREAHVVTDGNRQAFTFVGRTFS
ncbi:hypothetical protein FQN54_007371 [Arachnomyces sp. PD_36]|nr:hypothetical protein FQN54_007371 [Arachnomyces sp. PD_36]